MRAIVNFDFDLLHNLLILRGDEDERAAEAGLSVESDGTITHIRGTPNVTDIEIPKNSFVGKDFVEVVLHPGIRKIGGNGFNGCRQLTNIELPDDGLVEIDGGAFHDCSSLTHIHIPRSVKKMGMRVFDGCTSLKEITLHEGLQSIDEQSFWGCSSLKKIIIPSTITHISDQLFYGCMSLTDVHLHEGVRTIGEEVFHNCKSLLRINIPSTVYKIASSAFIGVGPCFRNVAISPSSPLTGKIQGRYGDFDVATLKSRFDGMPLHELCYYHSYRNNGIDDIIEWMTSTGEISGVRSSTESCKDQKAGFVPPPMKLGRMSSAASAACGQKDRLGMTPLNILACSGSHDLQLNNIIIDSNPEALSARDKYGLTPLEYVLLFCARKEVIYLFFKMHKVKDVELPFDFTEAILCLSKCDNTSPDMMRHIIQAQRNYFPNLQINWRYIFWSSETTFGVARVLAEAWASTRSVCMSDEHKIEIDAWLARSRSLLSIDDDGQTRQPEEILREKIFEFVRQYNVFLFEASTILEMALWKAVMEDNNSLVGNDRESTRVIGGKLFQVVIPNVLSFL